MPAVIGRAQGWAGGHWNQQHGFAAYWFPWERCDQTRLLFHSGLPLISQRQLDYPDLPDLTHNFTDEWIFNRSVQISKTQESSVATVHKGFPDDAIVKEIWNPGGGLSHTWTFFHRLFLMFHETPDREANEFILWRPLDRTFKAYEVEIVGLNIGGSPEEYESQFAGRIRTSPENFMTAAVELSLKLVREVPPQMTVQMIGGSITPEAVQVPGN